MNPATTVTESWQGFFKPATTHSERQFKKRLLLRGGRTFLLLPAAPALAARALDLYPAQTGPARLAKFLFRIAVRLGVPIGSRPFALRVDSGCQFSAYLSRLGGAPSGGNWDWAMLAGNPHTLGQRCIFLLFDHLGEPVAVVKAGGGSQAVSLVRREGAFLKAAAEGIAGIPRLRSEFVQADMAALAIDYFPGTSPAGASPAQIEKVLTPWVRAGQRVRVSDLASWQELETRAESEVKNHLATLRGLELTPVLFHGDFAPWNIKEFKGAWTVLDWERGETAGMPGWDWLHFIVQRAILVERLSIPDLTARLRASLGSPEFQRYAHVTGIRGCEPAITTAYLEYMIRVIQPSEGLEKTKLLLAAWRCSGDSTR